VSNIHPGRRLIVAGQLQRLNALVQAILPANPFYAARLQAAGAHGKLCASLSDFAANCPFTTKQDIAADQLARPPYGTNLTFPIERYTRYHQTSGTMGTPIRWLDTPESWDGLVQSWLEVLQAADVTANDHLLFAFSFGPFIGFWLAFEAASRLGALCIPAGGLAGSARLRMLRDLQATVLCCTPTYALHLAEAAAKEGVELAPGQLRRLIVAGEPGGSIPATRARLEKLWPGARVFDHHGMTEVGPVTHECPDQPGVLHVIESAYLAEVINPATGNAVAPGEIGELVLTTLGRTGSPLLRYRTGDLVKPGFDWRDSHTKPCACGRSTLTLQGGILGRTDDMVIVRGVNVYPSGVEEIVRAFPEVAEYQVSLAGANGLVEMELRVEPTADCVDPSGLAQRLQRAFQAALSLRVPVTAVPPNSLPRFEMKGRRWVTSTAPGP